MSLSAGERLGPYEILNPIGKGGMGEVYRAHDTRLRRDVAIKVSAEKFSERFEREARVVASLNHPNICALYDVGPNYLVMELVEGESPKGPLPVDEALRIAKQIADALSEAHEKGIVHRDLKPANIKITPGGTVKVLDFGLAKHTSPAPEDGVSENSPTISMAATQAGVILGTAAYMSPEQARGQVVDKRADIWAFGVVLYELLTGRRLFQGDTISDVLAGVLKSEPDWDRVPVKARRLLRSCLEKDPNRRLRDIADTWRLIDDAPEAAAVSKSRVPWLVAAVCAVAAVAFAVFLWRQWAAPKPPAEVMRFQIQAPNVGLGDVNVSPDGRQLSFIGANLTGQGILLVRSVNALEWRLLPGTEEAIGIPFWSSDSRSLTFSSNNKLRKIDISGGPPQVLCDASQVLGGFWTRDHRIVFALGGSGLRVVAEGGGVSSPLTTLDNSRGEAVHLLPSPLPDGRHFLYTRNGGSGAGTYIGSLDAKPDQQSSKLIVPNTPALYVPFPGSTVGRLVLSREGSILAQTFDPEKLELSGEPVPIGGPATSFSASGNGVLVYQNGGLSATQFGDRQLIWVDRQGKILGTATEPGLHNSIALSPDGTRIATARMELHPGNQNNLDVWLTDLAGGRSTRFTFFAGLDGVPIWSPDSSRVVFSSARSAPSDLYMHASNSAGGDELLLHSDQIKYATDWSKDGHLLYTNQGEKTGWDLWVLSGMNGSASDRKTEPFLQTEFNESGGQFSPDARWVAYTTDDSGKQEVFVQPFPASAGGGGKWQVSRGGGSQPRWRGKELFYLAPDNKLMAVEVTTTPVFKPGIPQALFDTHVTRSPVDQFIWDVTADGKKFLVVTGAPVGAAPPITVVVNWTAGMKQ